MTYKKKFLDFVRCVDQKNTHFDFVQTKITFDYKILLFREFLASKHGGKKVAEEKLTSLGRDVKVEILFIFVTDIFPPIFVWLIGPAVPNLQLYFRNM